MRLATLWNKSTTNDLKTKRLALFLISMLILMTFSVSAFAQGEKGTISGTVTDSSKAVVTGAQVTATSVDTSAARTATTDNLGNYIISSLAPGTYDVKVSKTGFGNYQQKFAVSPGIRTSVDVTLKAGGTNEVVEVVGHTETQVDTQTSSLSQVVDATHVAELPSLTRNPYDFVQMLGNVNQDSASGTGGLDEVARGAGVSFNGQRSASTDVLLDGVENVDLYTTKVGQSIPLDATQEFSVTSNNFSAEYGRASGGVINVVSKSGSNGFHGSLYEFNRLSAYTANTFDNNAQFPIVPKGKYTRNQFGYSIGGPIKKDKLFFFSSTEWLRVRSASNTIVAVPDPGLIAASSAGTKALFGAFTFRPGLTVTQKLNATAVGAPPAAGTTYNTYAAGGAPVMDLVSYPVPSDAGGGAPQNTWNMLDRVDLNLTDKTTLHSRYA